jgi:hypothetical protein
MDFSFKICILIIQIALVLSINQENFVDAFSIPGEVSFTLKAETGKLYLANKDGNFDVEFNWMEISHIEDSNVYACFMYRYIRGNEYLKMLRLVDLKSKVAIEKFLKDSVTHGELNFAPLASNVKKDLVILPFYYPDHEITKDRLNMSFIINKSDENTLWFNQGEVTDLNFFTSKYPNLIELVVFFSEGFSEKSLITEDEMNDITGFLIENGLGNNLQVSTQKGPKRIKHQH